MGGGSLRVAITGAGAVTPLGIGLAPLLDAMRIGRQGVSHLEGVPVPRGKSAVGLIRDSRFDAPDRVCRMAWEAARQALETVRERLGDGEDVALLVATVWGDSRAAEELYPEFAAAGRPSAELLRALRLFPNGSILNSLGNELHLFGPRLVVSNACASSNIALGLARSMMRFGHCRAALVVGAESVNLTCIWGAERSGFIGRELRPFHRQRDGSVLGEGAAALFLERSEDAPPNQVLGWLEGFGCVCDKGAAAITLLEDGSGLRRAMGLALEDGGRIPSEIEYVNAHAPGTPLIDRLECQAVADLMGSHASQVVVNATKSLTTHLSAASAVTEVIATLLQMRHGFLHPTARLDDPDPELAVRVVGLAPLQRPVTRALSNACGGGGLNTSVLVVAPQEPPPARAVRTLPTAERVVVVSGIGSVSALGAGASEVWRRPKAGAGAGRLEEFTIDRWYPPETNFSYYNRAAQLAAAAGAIALGDAGLASGFPYASDRVAVLAGTFLGGGPEASAVLADCLAKNIEAMRPSMALDHGNHLGAALVCRHFGFNGPTYTLTGTRVAGLQAVLVARELLLEGRADAAVVLGFDALDGPLMRAAPWLDDCWPLDRLGEGAGALVLETAAAARARAATARMSLGQSVTLAASLGNPTALAHAAERLAARLSTDWDEIYVSGPDTESLTALARELLLRAGRDAEIRQIQDLAGHCLAADPLLALCSAATRQLPVLVLSGEPDGVISALVTTPG
jgi:3-oxoacyl-[acyl-carrier-protein] synthase II